MCGSRIGFAAGFVQCETDSERLVFRIFIKESPWREGEAAKNRQRSQIRFRPDSFSQYHGGKGGVMKLK